MLIQEMIGAAWVRTGGKQAWTSTSKSLPSSLDPGPTPSSVRHQSLQGQISQAVMLTDCSGRLEPSSLGHCSHAIQTLSHQEDTDMLSLSLPPSLFPSLPPSEWSSEYRIECQEHSRHAINAHYFQVIVETPFIPGSRLSPSQTGFSPFRIFSQQLTPLMSRNEYESWGNKFQSHCNGKS